MPDAAAIARQAGLKYVNDQMPGIRRQRMGRGFSFFDVDGERICDRNRRQQLKALPVPPAWEEVWICPHPNGHLVATGRDAKGRKQYRYHPDWCRLRSQAKFERMVPFGSGLSPLRQQLDAHLRLPGLPRDRVLALVVQLLDKTLIRVGNRTYAKENQSFGLTTLRNRHVEVQGSHVEFEFRGKSGVEHQIALDDPQLAKLIKRCYEIPGYHLFQYFDEEGSRQQIDSGDVNAYLQRLTREDFTAKEFRTWAGTVLAAQELLHLGHDESETEAKRRVTQAVQAVAKQLGNRPATCRNYYVHPQVVRSYLAGSLPSVFDRLSPDPQLWLDAHEQGVLALLNSAPQALAA